MYVGLIVSMYLPQMQRSAVLATGRSKEMQQYKSWLKWWSCTVSPEDYLMFVAQEVRDGGREGVPCTTSIHTYVCTYSTCIYCEVQWEGEFLAFLV